MSFELPPLGATPRAESERIATAVEEASAREAAAERVGIGKQLLVDLDRRRHQTREAIRAVEKLQASRRAPPPMPVAAGTAAARSSLLFASAAVPTCGAVPARAPPTLWLLCEGDVFVETPVDTAEAKLRDDAARLAGAVEAAHQELNGAVAELAKLEGVDSAIGKLHAGFNLKGQ